MKRVTVEQRRLTPATTTPPLWACDEKLACIGAPGPRQQPAYVTGCLLERVGIFHGREGVVAQQMGGATGPWALVGTLPAQAPRILGWMA